MKDSTGSSHRLRTLRCGQMDAELVRPIGEEATDNFPRFARADASPLWGVFNTSRFVGFPGRARTYAGASPGQADALPALVEIAPR